MGARFEGSGNFKSFPNLFQNKSILKNELGKTNNQIAA